MSSSPKSSTSVRPDKITSDRFLRNRRNRLRSSSLGSLFSRKSRNRRHRLSPTPKHPHGLSFPKKRHNSPQMLRTVSKDDKLLARGANPRTGLISPSGTGSLDNFSDYVESKLKEVSIPVQGMWKQDEQQWSFVQTEDESRGEPMHKRQSDTPQGRLRRQSPGDTELFRRYQRELQRGLEACGDDGLIDPFEARTPRESSDGPSSPRPSLFMIKRKPVPSRKEKEKSRREGSTGTVIINGKEQDTTRPALGRLIREGHVNIVTPKPSPPRSANSAVQDQITIDPFLDQQHTGMSREADLQLGYNGNYRAHEIDTSLYEESYDPQWAQQITSTPQTPKQTSGSLTLNLDRQNGAQVPTSDFPKASPRRVTFSTTEIHYRRLPSPTDSSLTHSTSTAHSLAETLTSMSQDEESQDGALQTHQKSSSALAVPTITTTTTITPTHQALKGRTASSPRPEPMRLPATGGIPQTTLPYLPTNPRVTNNSPRVHGPAPSPSPVLHLDIPQHRLPQPLQNHRRPVIPRRPHYVKTHVSYPTDQLPSRVRFPPDQRLVDSPWPRSAQRQVPQIRRPTPYPRLASYIRLPIEHPQLTGHHPLTNPRPTTQPTPPFHRLSVPLNLPLPRRAYLSIAQSSPKPKIPRPPSTPLLRSISPTPIFRRQPRPVSLAAATAMTTHRLPSGGVLPPTHPKLLLRYGYNATRKPSDNYQGWVRTNADVLLSSVHLPLQGHRKPSPSLNQSLTPSHLSLNPRPSTSAHLNVAKMTVPPSAGEDSFSSANHGHNGGNQSQSPSRVPAWIPKARASTSRQDANTDITTSTKVAGALWGTEHGPGKFPSPPGKQNGAVKAAAHSFPLQNGSGAKQELRDNGGKKGSMYSARKDGEGEEKVWRMLDEEGQGGGWGGVIGSRYRSTGVEGRGELDIPKKRTKMEIRAYKRNEAEDENLSHGDSEGGEIWEILAFDGDRNRQTQTPTSTSALSTEVTSLFNSLTSSLPPFSHLKNAAQNCLGILCEMLRHLSRVIDSESEVLNALREDKTGRARGTSREQWEACMEILRAAVYGVVLVYLGVSALRVGGWIWGWVRVLARGVCV